MYQCTYCKTGTMKSADQYLTHIKATKHKKKAFQLMAPHAGIEYEEFRPKPDIIEPTLVENNDSAKSLPKESGTTECCQENSVSSATVTVDVPIKSIAVVDGTAENGQGKVNSSVTVPDEILIYQCTYCKTGTMKTAEQYLTHIKAIKHKKKAFQLLAPYEGIEYEEFRPKIDSIEPTLEENNGEVESLPNESGTTECCQENIVSSATVTVKVTAKTITADDGTAETRRSKVDSSATVPNVAQKAARERSRSPIPTGRTRGK